MEGREWTVWRDEMRDVGEKNGFETLFHTRPPSFVLFPMLFLFLFLGVSFASDAATPSISIPSTASLPDDIEFEEPTSLVEVSAGASSW